MEALGRYSKLIKIELPVVKLVHRKQENYKQLTTSPKIH